MIPQENILHWPAGAIHAPGCSPGGGTRAWAPGHHWREFWSSSGHLVDPPWEQRIRDTTEENRAQGPHGSWAWLREGSSGWSRTSEWNLENFKEQASRSHDPHRHSAGSGHPAQTSQGWVEGVLEHSEEGTQKGPLRPGLGQVPACPHLRAVVAQGDSLPPSHLSALTFGDPVFFWCRYIQHSKPSPGFPNLSVQPHLRIPSSTPLNPYSPLAISHPRALRPSLHLWHLKLRDTQGSA